MAWILKKIVILIHKFVLIIPRQKPKYAYGYQQVVAGPQVLAAHAPVAVAAPAVSS